jgi:acetylornithine/succinyldiaminopimelate/putrescine aminotransferase
VYAVFHRYSSGRLEWIGAAETEERALLLARMWSRYGNSEVIVVENGDNGRTEHRFTFCRGEQQAATSQTH